jgi:hypothetical protein
MKNELTLKALWKAFCFSAMLAFANHVVAAETATLIKQDQLRDDPYIDAKAIATVAAHSRAEVVEDRGVWIRIKAEAGLGWVRATSVKRDGVIGPRVAPIASASGRLAVTTPTASLGIRGVTPDAGTTHALIMTIGDYQGGIPKLKGVMYDVESARSIAHLLGVKDEDIIQLHDEQLTLEGMQHAFDELDQRVAQNDKVFIYYSGHGGRQRVHDPEERCAESLVTVNGYGLIDAELEIRLKKLSQRTQKIIAMFDSCHSGGVTTRGITGSMYTPKYWSKGGEGGDACAKPVNVVTRGIKLAMQSEGSGGNNYVYIAAAKDDEVSLDQQGKGGMATQTWLACMSGDAVDMDKSGGLSVEEIQDCAQKKIDGQMKGAKGFLPQHISITGNSQLVMTLVSKNTKIPPEQEAQPTPVAQSDVESGASATLSDIYNGRDDRRTVKLSPTQNKLKIGNEKFNFSIRSSNAGYLYLLMVGSDGKTFDLLFPNKLDGDNYIQAGQTVQFPRSSWDVFAQGPAGKDHILAIVADAPRDLSKLPVVNAGPFSEVSATQGGKRGIHLVTFTSSLALQTECADARKRKLAVKQVCSDAYGAALAEVEEDE